MELFIDSADIKTIEQICDLYPIDGVTTNPTILKRAGGAPLKVLQDIRALMGENLKLHIQAISQQAEALIEEAKYIMKKIPGRTFVKIPATPEGLKAMKKLHAYEVPMTATVIYTPMQALLAAKCGATYVAPYVNRMDNMGYDGVRTAVEIHTALQKQGYATKVLGASFKNAWQVFSLLEKGIDAVTCAPEVIHTFASGAAIYSADKDFRRDFIELTGKDSMTKLMKTDV